VDDPYKDIKSNRNRTWERKPTLSHRNHPQNKL
jgi:hypothetical protein